MFSLKLRVASTRSLVTTCVENLVKKRQCCFVASPSYGLKYPETRCIKHKRLCFPAGFCTQTIKTEQQVLSGSNLIGDLYKDIDYNEITGNDEALLKKLKVLLLEVEVMRQDGSLVPSHISTARWKELLHCETRSQRLKLLSFLFKTEKKKESELKKKIAKKEKTEAVRAEIVAAREQNPHINYGFGGCTIFLRVYNTTMDHQANNKLAQAMRFGQDLVVDMSYDKYMNNKETSLCVKQLVYLFASNRVDRDPFNIHFCRADPDSNLVKKLQGQIPCLYDPDFPVNITDKSYLDLFPKEKLVYLTPHCKDDLKEFNHDDVYIIGGMVDKVNCEPLSLGIAKREGLRMASLPLDRYLNWNIGSKSLTVNQVLMILLELKSSQNWHKALSHVPRRKILTENEPVHRVTKGPSLYRKKIFSVLNR